MIDRARRQKDATWIKRTGGEGRPRALILAAGAFTPIRVKVAGSSLGWMNDPARHKTSTRDIVKAMMASVSSRCVNFTLLVLYESTLNPSQPYVKVNSVDL